MKKWLDAFGGLRFRTKMVLSTLAAAVVPLLLFSLVLGSFFIYDIVQKSSQLSLQVVNQTSESLDIYISTIEKLMDYVIREGSSVNAEDAQSRERVQEITDEILKSYPEIAGITIAYGDDSYVGAGMTRISRDLFVDEQWYQYAMAREGELGVIGSAVGRNVVGNLNDSSDSIFSLVKSFRRGVVLFDIRHDMIKQLINRVSIGERGFMYVADDNDVVYTPPNPVVYRIDPDSYSTPGIETDTICVAGEQYFIANHHSSYSGWRVIGVIPRAEFRSNLYQVYEILIFCLIVSILLIIPISVAVSGSVTKPIYKLCSLMTQVEAGDFTVRFKPRYQDEIGVLGLSFNHMLEKTDALVNELYREKQIRLEAQLKSLQEQIKPHFLYNTLDTISWMARAQNAMDVVRLVDALTNMFRVGLSNGKDYITLREEKVHVTNYLYIQKVRYQDKLRYSIDIPESFDDVVVPKLILQPLVENAIYHGIKCKRGGGEIRLTAEESESTLYLHVWDSGAGIPPEKLEQLRQEIQGDSTEKSSFGLPYISKRIRLSYGQDYGVSINSREGEFTEVILSLPGRKEADNV